MKDQFGGHGTSTGNRVRIKTRIKFRNDEKMWIERKQITVNSGMNYDYDSG